MVMTESQTRIVALTVRRDSRGCTGIATLMHLTHGFTTHWGSACTLFAAAAMDRLSQGQGPKHYHAPGTHTTSTQRLAPALGHIFLPFLRTCRATPRCRRWCQHSQQHSKQHPHEWAVLQRALCCHRHVPPAACHRQHGDASAAGVAALASLKAHRKGKFPGDHSLKGDGNDGRAAVDAAVLSGTYAAHTQSSQV
jgi:hypothetical protein